MVLVMILLVPTVGGPIQNIALLVPICKMGEKRANYYIDIDPKFNQFCCSNSQQYRGKLCFRDGPHGTKNTEQVQRPCIMVASGRGLIAKLEDHGRSCCCMTITKV